MLDVAGSRILAKGIGLDPVRYEKYEKRGVFDPTGGLFSFAGFIGELWSIPYPTVLAFDLFSLRREVKSENSGSMAKPLTTKEKAVNAQLIAAAFGSDLGAVKRSLENGADVNATDEYGATALMLAAESLPVYRKSDVVELLIKRGAEPSLRDPQGWTACDYYAIIPSNAKADVSKALQLLVKERSN